MSPFFTRIAARAAAIDSALCVGLDPLTTNPATLVSDCLRIAEATHPFAVAYKPNSAFFERHGGAGISALHALISQLPADVPVILDAKRGDIGKTNTAYADAAFASGAHAVTVSPYLGLDALTPFEQDPRHGIFVLCRTSNEDACNMQALQLASSADAGGPMAVFEWVARHVARTRDPSRVGLVVGATDLPALRKVRARAPDHWLLVPGIGAQGGDLEAAVRAGMRADGRGLLVNVSSALAECTDRADLARRYVDRMRQAARPIASGAKPLPVSRAVPDATRPWSALHATLADGLLRAGVIRFGTFALKSGKVSPFYLDFRRLIGFPDLLALAARAFADLLAPLTFDCIAGLPYAGLPLATATSLHTGTPMVYPRKEAKSYGTKAAVEGVLEAGARAVLLDDLATTGGSKLEALEKLAEAGLCASDVVVLVDREGGATAELAGAGLTLHAFYTVSELLTHYAQTRAVAQELLAAARSFLHDDVAR